MRQLLGLLVFIIPMTVNANLSFTKQDLIGKWECKLSIDKDFRSESVIEYRDDGTFTDRTVLYSLAKNDDLYQIDTFRMLSRWQLVDDKVRYYDNIIQSYQVDMPNYDNMTDFSHHQKETMLIIKAMMGRAETEQIASDDMISRIRFLDQNTYISAFESMDEDFPADIENNHCKRKL